MAGEKYSRLGGGADGFVYDAMRHFYGPKFNPIYDVVDTSSNLAHSSHFGASDRKRFFDNFAPCIGQKYGLAMATGMIHLLPEPRKSLDEFFSNDLEYAFIGRCPIMPELKRDRLAIFRSGHSYPCWFFSENWRNKLEEYGQIIFEIKDYDNPYMLDGSPVISTSFLIKKRIGAI